jgi:hypothetical protein
MKPLARALLEERIREWRQRRQVATSVAWEAGLPPGGDGPLPR